MRPSLLLPLALALPGWAATLAVDFGADWTKASVVGPKMEILLNTDSKRKFQSAVGWKATDRVFGTDAYSVAARFPADTFLSLKYLVGAQYDSPRTEYYKTISPVKTYATPRGTVGLIRSDGTQWTVEELIAMQFAYLKHVADSAGGDPVRDILVTVPAFYSQFERQAISDAIEIAGLRPAGLVNDGAAIAVNYAMTRSFPSVEHHIIYDAGASTTTATLVSFRTVDANSTATKSESTIIEVKGLGYDELLGGTELDRRLREILADKFEATHKRSLRNDPKAMAKLWKEAGRVKTVLSVNNDARASIESLAFDLDFKSSVSRAEFETACDDLHSRFSQPLLDALAQSKLTLDDITSVILAGGASRTPMIQAAIAKVVGEPKIARTLNADEAATVGASLYGATLSRHFRTKDIKVHDISSYDIQVVYTAESKTEPGKIRTIHNQIFAKGGKLGVKKTLSLKRKEDFTIALEYKTIPPFPSQIVEATFEGVGEAIGNLTEAEAIDPLVKITLALDENSFASVDAAVAYGEIKDNSLTGKLKSLFAGSSTAPATPDVATEETGATSSTSTSSGDSETSSAAAEGTETASPVASPSPSVTPEVKPKPKDTYPLRITLKHGSVPPLTSAEKAESKSRLRSVDTEEKNKVLNAEARNVLEGYIYRLRDLLEGGNDSPFFEFSQESERAKLKTLLEEVSEWMHDAGDSASTAELVAKKKALEAIETPIQTRNREFHAAPAAIRDLQQAIIAGRTFVQSARENRTLEESTGFEPKYTLDEVDGVERKINETTTWLEERVTKQDKLARNQDPVLLSKDVESRGKALQSQVMRLLKRKWIPRVKKTATTAPSSETPTAGSETATAHTGRPTDEL
ncbi:HSP70-domain-containing protein [Auricularia subglabra TFB-10046 SS5]|nr:HSP70-domain-containing protein [Auricularia subglabra TFB-10046 SS5]